MRWPLFDSFDRGTRVFFARELVYFLWCGWFARACTYSTNENKWSNILRFTIGCREWYWLEYSHICCVLLFWGLMDLPRRVQLLLGDQQAGLGQDMPLHLDHPHVLAYGLMAIIPHQNRLITVLELITVIYIHLYTYMHTYCIYNLYLYIIYIYGILHVGDLFMRLVHHFQVGFSLVPGNWASQPQNHHC